MRFTFFIFALSLPFVWSLVWAQPAASWGSTNSAGSTDSMGNGVSAEAAAGTRLLVTDAESTDAHVLALEDNAVLASFSTPGEAGRVYRSPNGRFGFVVHRDENRVSLIHSGLTTVDHVDHVDLVQGAPYVAATMNVGREPTHLFAHGNDIAVFNDEEGTVALLDQRLLRLSLDYTELTVEQPDHGAPVVHGDHVLNGYYDLERVDIYERSGALVQTIEGCPGLHGAGHSGDSVVYGCEDGVLLIGANGSEFSSSKLPNPANRPQDVRVGTVAAHEDSPAMVGNFGEGVVIIDPAAETLTPMALSASPLGMTFADGETLVVLTADGQLHALEPTSGEARANISVIGAVDTEAEDVVRPSLTVQGDLIYVSDPAAQQVHEVSLSDLRVERSLELDFTPYSLAVLAIPGATIHD